jgi:hypothetical protein
MKTNLVLMAFAFAVGTAHAQSGTTIESIKVEPAMIKAGETAKVTVTGTEGEIPNCGMRLHFGDGSTQDFKLTKKGMLPIVVEHKYEKEGDYKVMAEPKVITTHLKCIGKNQNAMIKVAAVQAPAPAPVAAAPAAAPLAAPVAAPAAVKVATGPTCPEGWKLNAKSVVKKTGAFKCTAPAGTKLPEKKLTCPGDLSYVENSKKGLIACQL